MMAAPTAKTNTWLLPFNNPWTSYGRSHRYMLHDKKIDGHTFVVFGDFSKFDMQNTKTVTEIGNQVCWKAEAI